MSAVRAAAELIDTCYEQDVSGQHVSKQAAQLQAGCLQRDARVEDVVGQAVQELLPGHLVRRAKGAVRGHHPHQRRVGGRQAERVDRHQVQLLLRTIEEGSVSILSDALGTKRAGPPYRHRPQMHERILSWLSD